MKQKYLKRRGRVYEYRRSVPPHLRPVFGKCEFVKSLHTSDPDEALLRFVEYNRKVDALIRSAEAGDSILSLDPSCLKGLADGLGLVSVDPSDLRPDQMSHSSVQQIVAALLRNALEISEIGSPTKVQIAALADTVRPFVSLTEVAKRYENLTRDRWSKKASDREKQKFYIPIHTAVAEFDEVLPKANVLSLTPSDVEKFRSHLVTKVECGAIKANTANRKIINLRKIVKRFFEVEYRGKSNPFDGCKIVEHDNGKRAPLTDTEYANVIKYLVDCKNNPELVALINVMLNTGTSCKEICLLTASDIHLGAEIPFIRISENQMRDKVKSGGSRHRDLPLLGDALTSMKAFPTGFPRYRRENGSEAASAACNKLLRGVTDKTTYSFRHRIADKLRNSGCSDSLKDAIMGHSTPGMGSHYGRGYDLSAKREALATALGLAQSGVPNGT